jgi:hypothetical protein
MSTGAEMAKKRSSKPGARSASQGEQREEIVAVRCKATWKDWLQRFADRERTTPTALIDKGLAELAQRLKFEEPPKR